LELRRSEIFIENKSPPLQSREGLYLGNHQLAEGKLSPGVTLKRFLNDLKNGGNKNTYFKLETVKTICYVLLEIVQNFLK
jgi:hypothetical protein